jgi:CubicO group peptidase (beta-lactamase class C family)
MNHRPTLLGLCAFAWTLHAAADPRIDRIENGLREPVAVRGAPARTMRLLDRMRDLHVPGVSIAVIDHGRIAWTRAYGVADVDSGRPVTPATLFQVASISKPVAAVVALRSRVDLDADVSKRLRGWRLPDSPLTARHPVTARALLSHTAGVSADDLAGYPAAQPCPTLPQALAKVEIESEPGSRYAYSSPGYGVLQQVLVDITGRPFDALARATVFAPLGMRASLFASTLPAALAPQATKGHALDGTPVPGGWHCYPEQAAAGLWTTASDLARFAIALQDGRRGFLTRQQIDALLTPVRDDYGLGFELGHAGKEPSFHHSGSNAGYKAQLWAYTRIGQGAVILTNGDHGATLIAELMRAIATEYGWEDWRPIERAAVPADPALFDGFAGSYAVSNVVLRVERRGDRLYLAGPPLGPERVELIPAGDHDFFVREKDATLHFDAAVDGRVETLTFVDGRPRPGRRVSP